MDAFILGKVTSMLAITLPSFGKFGGLNFADMDFDRPRRMDSIHEADYFFEVWRHTRLSDSPGSAVAQDNLFGFEIKNVLCVGVYIAYYHHD